MKSPRFFINNLAWLGLLVLFLVFSCHSWFGPDIWYHLDYGKRILESGLFDPPDKFLAQQPNYLNIYWLYQLAVYFLYAMGGPAFVTLGSTLLWGTVIFFILKTTNLKRIPEAPFLALIGVLILQLRFEDRPELVAYTMLSIQIYCHCKWDFETALSRKQLALFLLTEVIMANSHGNFAFGPFLCGFRFLLEWISGSSSLGGLERRLNLARLGFVCLVGSLVNPYGVGVWKYFFDLADTFRVLKTQIEEFKPLTGEAFNYWITWVFWGVWVATVVIGAYHGWRNTISRWKVGFALLGVFLSAISYRNIPFLILLSAPLWGGVIRRRCEPRPRLIWWSYASLILAILLIPWVASNGYYRSFDREVRFGFSLREYDYPIQFTNFLKAHPFSGKLFNNPSDGGYLGFFIPNLQLYGDSRFSNGERTMEYFDALSSAEALRHLHLRHDFDGVLLKIAFQKNMLGLLMSPEWKLNYSDICRALLVYQNPNAPASFMALENRIYRGEDLSESTNARCIISWIQGLTDIRNTGVLNELASELTSAERIPSPIFGVLLAGALNLGDRGLGRKVLLLRDKMFLLEAADGPKIQELAHHLESLVY